ncbi:DUF3142 domain-containing protein [Pseudomonas sp. B329]|uniref:DUF3142 domain-containing protein n=1 Tax=Pseudomonas sp. B329 TaxID=1553459 RepID=UPI002002FEE3|nr:DUF3142 domain-containing protein [Pseudomonas sp. B329]MCK3866126.1 DUF3142 domain-containing protein [Pseudomonas sp. B329]
MKFRSLRLAGVLVALIFVSSHRSEIIAPLDQQVYVWQRQWNASHALALAQSRGDFSTLRVLALQAFPGAGWSRARVDFALLRGDGRPVIAVVRLDGQLKALNQADITLQIQQLLSHWQGQGVNLAGLEIDHDAGSARLANYRQFLQQLRSALPATLKLSITALPAWLDSPELSPLLQTVDSSVLQVHAVSDPRHGLFDPQQARRWAERWSRVTSKPYYLALPSYGVALLPTPAGATVVVESEVPIDRGGRRQELLADPQQLAMLVGELRADPPKHLAGLVWFRLPLPGDRRAWSMATLRTVASGEALAGQLTLVLTHQDGLYDIAVSNPGNLDAAWPAHLVLTASKCETADALAGYSVQKSTDQMIFVRHIEGRLAAGDARAVGWARCSHINQGASYVRP